MDSLAFMRWASQRYVDPGLRFVLNVLVACIGLQEVGGMIEKTQQEIGEELGGYSRSHISWALRVLVEDGALRRVRRGVYQLAPSAALRGGMRPLEQGKSGAAGKVKGERVDQLDLLKQILEDPDAPAAFKSMAQADAQLPEGPRPGTKGKAKE
ncbi:hypothetical protein [Streptomyces sp. NPDC001568]|uniref:hypothetical protein n=1 Tax=Streptomyces sp. NPDC001568 TaxID=3364588 RepID=UPI0036AA4406